jgi:hypothetical protein
MRELLKNVKSLPDVEIGQTPEDFKIIAERTLQNKEKVIYYLGSVELLVKAYEQAYEDDYYIPTRMDLGILVKMLAPDTEAMRKYQATDSREVRETRCLPADVVMDYSVMIHDDTAVFFCKDEQLYALSITAPAVARTLKAMFQEMWRTAGT